MSCPRRSRTVKIGALDDIYKVDDRVSKLAISKRSDCRKGMGVSAKGRVSCFVVAWACERPIHGGEVEHVPLFARKSKQRNGWFSRRKLLNVQWGGRVWLIDCGFAWIDENALWYTNGRMEEVKFLLKLAMAVDLTKNEDIIEMLDGAE